MENYDVITTKDIIILTPTAFDKLPSDNVTVPGSPYHKATCISN